MLSQNSYCIQYNKNSDSASLVTDYAFNNFSHTSCLYLLVIKGYSIFQRTKHIYTTLLHRATNTHIKNSSTPTQNNTSLQNYKIIIRYKRESNSSSLKYMYFLFSICKFTLIMYMLKLFLFVNTCIL